MQHATKKELMALQRRVLVLEKLLKKGKFEKFIDRQVASSLRAMRWSGRFVKDQMNKF